MRLHRMRSRAGVSLIELTVYSGVVGVIGLWGVNFMKVPLRVDQFHQQTRLERNLNSALDAIVSDLREADPASIGGAIMALPSSSIAFQVRPSFDINQPSNPSDTQITYDIQKIGGAPSLVRTVRSVVTGSLVASQVLFSAADPSVTLTPTFSAVAGYNYTIDIRLDYAVPAVPTPITTTVTRRAVTRS